MRTWLKEIRERGGRPQEAIARECGISRQYYGYIEAGTRNCPVPTAKRIAAAMGFAWQKFYEEETK